MIRIDKDQFREQFNENLDQLPVVEGRVAVKITDGLTGKGLHVKQTVRWLEFENEDEMRRYLDAVLQNAIVETDVQEVES